jgi:hypothetical protein
MVDPITTESVILNILPSLIGAISGSFGGNIFSDYLKQQGDKKSKRSYIIDMYLIQLQDFYRSVMG